MPLLLTWPDIFWRLALTLVAGMLLGFNREERGRAAGLCTTTLVTLAASLSMIQANWLMTTAGKPSDSFAVLDLMRLPLGILSGMGFIGGGVILKQDMKIRGVTTAATLWFATVMGLCFGGGQLGLGIAALVLALLILYGLKHIEDQLKRTHRGKLRITRTGEAASNASWPASLARGYTVRTRSIIYSPEVQQQTTTFEVEWESNRKDTSPPTFLEPLMNERDIVRLHWQPLPE